VSEPAQADPRTERLEWTATEYQRRFGPWRLVAVVLVGLWLMVFLYALGQWSAALLASVVTLALVIVWGGKPRSWHYVVTSDQVRITALHPHGHGAVYPISAFRAFAVEEDHPRGDDGVHFSLLLLPAKRWALPADLYLTGDSEIDAIAIDRLARVLPGGLVSDYLATERILHGLAKALRIE
jgi:hypothetical protein